MARYTGPACKLCRREGKKLYLKGRSLRQRQVRSERRTSAPGQHGADVKKMREYGMQLREKQTAKRYYGVLEAPVCQLLQGGRPPRGMTGENLLILLSADWTTSFTVWVWLSAAAMPVSSCCTVTSP